MFVIQKEKKDPEDISVSDIYEIIKEINKEKKKQKKSKEPEEEKEPKTKDRPEKPNTEEKPEKEEINQQYQEENFYNQKQLDYNKLFNFKNNIYKQEYDSPIKKQEEEKTSEMTAEELEKIIRKEQINMMIGNNLDRPDAEEKEKYRYWAKCNRLMNMILIDENMVGNTIPGVFYV
ncbi:hypothetical protein GF361_05515 [Candidatus Woesearchaeota archaeon]|nr:hypothetical protein [Candidatus Woesearchaeota archaeon]